MMTTRNFTRNFTRTLLVAGLLNLGLASTAATAQGASHPAPSSAHG